MPPVRRRQRVRNKRRDAAFDAMRPFGFSDDLIRKHLNQLLKVYGNDGWAFIEENCYKVLTDAILDSIEQNQPEQDNQTDNQPEPDDPIDVPEPEVGGKELAVLQPVKEEPDVENHAACQGAMELVKQGQMVEVENVPEPEVGGKELAVLQPVKEEPDVENHAACQDVQRLKLDIRARGAAPYTNPKSRGVQTPKPCYGWISNDDESD